MCFMAAIEHSNIHKRISLKMLIIFGCSHYRLSFLFFFTTMIVSMWCYSITACALMIPLVKAILIELEKLGIVEPYENTNRPSNGNFVPSDIVTFYYLGVAYSSSIGAMATVIGNETNQIFKAYCEKIFPLGPRMEFPHFMLLTLPGVLMLQAFLYFWMNFYFLGMFRIQNRSVASTYMSEEEAQYVQTLLTAQYQKMGRVSPHEMILSLALMSTLGLQAVSTFVFQNDKGLIVFKLTSPSIVAVAFLFIIPINLDIARIFRRPSASSATSEQFTSRQCKTCLTWSIVKDSVQWSVLFVIVSTDAIFEALKESHMIDELETFLLLFKGPTSLLIFVTIIMFKILTEFVSSSCLVYCAMPHIARVSVTLKINPHYLMSSAVLASCLPFHLIAGTPANALVVAYGNIPRKKMMLAGTGLSVIGILVVWFTVTVWSRAIWPDINMYPEWANIHQFINN
ncbi:protein I'm not dead yet-like [Zerene cesonia]|uniref:protein I'm not dead yet-like n=1 Tax=Zerene cesonia TaxID=33412 RepID=UPI0018E54615|nr:protein I'm not dead yet-like [Zerene cesonia]